MLLSLREQRPVFKDTRHSERAACTCAVRVVRNLRTSDNVSQLSHEPTRPCTARVCWYLSAGRGVFDFIVVGGGIAGTGVADALAASARVALVEAETHPGYHSTARSAALFAPNYGSEPFRALARLSGAFLRAPPADFCTTALLHARGALNIARSDQRAHLEKSAAEIRARGGDIRELSFTAARELLPLLRPAYVACATYEPDVLDIDVAALLQGFLRRGKARGVQLLLGERVAAASFSAGAWQISHQGRTITGRVLVNAAGAWADELAIRCGGAPLGLQPLRRTAALIEAPPQVAVNHWPAVFDIDECFYLKPDAGRLLISPADEEPTPPGDVYPEDLAVAVAVDRIQGALDIEVRRVTHSWAGLRTFAPDRNPVIGFDEQLPSFFWCCGQGGYGIQTSPAVSQLAAALARGEPIQRDIAALGLTAAQVSPARLRRAP